MSTSWAGFLGTVLVIIAYMPQILHLIRNQCSAGISIKAYLMWMGASFLLLAHAFSLSDPVFIALQSYQMGATVTIVIFAQRYKSSLCELHQHRLNSASF